MKTMTRKQPNGQPVPDLEVLEVLLKDPTISEIEVLGPDRIFVVRRGKREATDRRFRSAQHLMQIISWLVERAGQHLDKKSPVIEGQLPDGSQLRVVLAPTGAAGPTLSIRRVPLE
jgi:pilus assembly protein CpaF